VESPFSSRETSHVDNRTVKRQNFQIPRFDDLIASLSNAKIFSSLDGVSGYFQIPIHKDSQHLLTFLSEDSAFNAYSSVSVLQVK